MPGVILKVNVKPGDEVKAGTPLCVLVAMKMENEIRSPIDGVVKEVYITAGDKMAVNDKMLVVESWRKGVEQRYEQDTLYT